jgi:lipase chaperone LimK
MAKRKSTKGQTTVNKTFQKFYSPHHNLVDHYGISVSQMTKDMFHLSQTLPKGQSESIYRRRTDNTMAKRKSTKGQTTVNKTFI